MAQASVSAQQDVGKLKDISFREVQGKDKPFNECLRNMPQPPAVITAQCRISPLNDYRDVVTVAHFHKTFSITDSGISRPKIVDCVGSDGIVYRQLVKGGDDLRQDAVMQQVFEKVSSTLRTDHETRLRNLGIRTYKIIPLTSLTGVIEWVNNTIPFGSYLTDKDKVAGAHSRYNPSDWSHSKCGQSLRTAPREDLQKVYDDICRNFNPVFRYFFIENYPDPVEWLTSIATYTRSVAVFVSEHLSFAFSCNSR